MTHANLIDFIHDLVEQLMLNSHYNAPLLHQAIDEVRTELAEMAGHYDAPVPEGAEAVRDLMLECLQLFDGALGEVGKFVDDLDEERLRLAVAQAEEAHDLLSLIEDLVQTHKNILSEMVEA